MLLFHRKLCSKLCGRLEGRGVWGRMDSCIGMAEFFVVHLKISQHCWLAILQYKIKSLKKNKICSLISIQIKLCFIQKHPTTCTFFSEHCFCGYAFLYCSFWNQHTTHLIVHFLFLRDCQLKVSENLSRIIFFSELIQYFSTVTLAISQTVSYRAPQKECSKRRVKEVNSN